MSCTRTVLIIDDDSSIRESLQIVMEDLGYRVLTESDGNTGTERALKEQPDIIFCDMMMPNASGFTVLQRLKNERHLDIPIVMLTANQSNHQRCYAEFLGVDLYLAKPIRLSKVKETLRKLCPLPENEENIANTVGSSI